MEDGNAVFQKFNFWRHHELVRSEIICQVGLNQSKDGPVDNSECCMEWVNGIYFTKSYGLF